MTTPNTIVTHLQTYLPMFTDTFSSLLSYSAVSAGLGNVKTITSAAHGFTTGRKIIVSAGNVRNSVNSVVVNGDGTATITTDYDHDLITPKYELDQKTITLTGFSPAAWNYQADIIEKTTGTELIISTSETVAPTANGYFPGTRNITGFQTLTVVDADTLTYTVTGKQIPVGPVDDFEATTGFRIYSAATIERAEQIYTEQGSNEDALYIIMGDMDISRDRHTMNDAIAAFTPQDYQLMTTMTNFESIVFIGTSNDIAATTAIERCYTTIYKSLLACFYGFGFESQQERIPYVTVSAGHGPGQYNRAYYQHVYSWQAPAMITFEDGFAGKIGPLSTVLEEIRQTWDLNSDEEAQLTATNILR